jgi:plastocyanin
MLKKVFVVAATGIVISGGAFAAEHTVDQKGKKFSTASISVKKGDKINFTNNDRIAHHIYSKGGFTFDSGRLPKGKAFAQVFDKNGTFKIRCKMHPKMKLAVTVQ